MAFGLDRHGLHDGRFQRFQGVVRVAQYGAQVHRMFVAKAEQQATFRGDPYPVAQVAEILTVG